MVKTENYRNFPALIPFQARNYIKSLPPTKKKDFNEVFRGANPLAIDLLERMLELDSDKRITAEQALAHKYLEKYADPNDEPVSPLYDQSFEDMDLPVEKWKGTFAHKQLSCVGMPCILIRQAFFLFSSVRVGVQGSYQLCAATTAQLDGWPMKACRLAIHLFFV